MKTFLAATLSIALSVAAQFTLKSGMVDVNAQKTATEFYSPKALFSVLTNVYVIFGFLLYGLGALVWLGVLSKWDVSKAYPLVGIGFVFTAVIGFYVGEEINIYRLVGVLLICVGIVFVGKS